MKNNPLFDIDYCNDCWRPILNNRPEKIEKMIDGLKKVWSSIEKRKEMSEMIKKKCRLSGYMIGDKNPMKNDSIKKLVGETRSKKMTMSERKKYSEGTKRAWEEGKFIGVNNAWKCLWHDYKHSNGKVYKVQGTWELKFIEWLDLNNLEFRCHKDRFQYIDDEGRSRNYYPDFFVYNWDTYVDVKSDYVYKKQSKKFKILDNYNNLKLKILFKEDLIKLGIKI